MTNYFTTVKTIDELKQQYRTLARKLHPDNGGSKEAMQELNKQYDELFKKVKNTYTKSDGTTYTRDNNEDIHAYTNIINSIINLNCDIEIIGSWVWCFNAYECREVLKKLGFRWANKKKAWYWHSEEDTCNSHKSTPMEEIRGKYGSTQVKTYQDIKTLTA